ncbi:MAG: hypothetical protein O7E52_02085, partial [Candidatus Poribacteria bacterium]|nr:hypothetical protein [Candidatus Poribacteria bacterium]
MRYDQWLPQTRISSGFLKGMPQNAAMSELPLIGVDFAFDAIGVRPTNEQILPVTRSGGPGA